MGDYTVTYVFYCQRDYTDYTVLLAGRGFCVIFYQRDYTDYTVCCAGQGFCGISLIC